MEFWWQKFHLCQCEDHSEFPWDHTRIRLHCPQTHFMTESLISVQVFDWLIILHLQVAALGEREERPESGQLWCTSPYPPQGFQRHIAWCSSFHSPWPRWRYLWPWLGNKEQGWCFPVLCNPNSKAQSWDLAMMGLACFLIAGGQRKLLPGDLIWSPQGTAMHYLCIEEIHWGSRRWWWPWLRGQSGMDAVLLAGEPSCLFTSFVHVPKPEWLYLASASVGGRSCCVFEQGQRGSCPSECSIHPWPALHLCWF